MYKLGCTGKIPYWTQGSAKDAARVMKANGHAEIYYCKYLNYDKAHWHVTSMPRSTFKRLRRSKNVT